MFQFVYVSSSRGRVTVKVVPAPLLLAALMCPPWAFRIERAMCRPSPVPSSRECLAFLLR